MPAQPLPLDELEALTHQDPGGRRLPWARVRGQFLDVGQLAQAVESLAAAGSVAIVTGFCTLSADPPADETDGPPGALYLARALLALGVRVQLISDCFGVPLLRVGCRHWNLPATMIVEAPWQPNTPTAFRRCGQWCLDRVAASDWTHLIAIERPGPLSDTGARSFQQLRRLISAERWHAGGSCFNMRGNAIDAITAPLHTLFQAARLLPRPIKTIG
ncbi:MAG TPA: glutamate cyclase domain-containing protein, partial [Pirellulales bacterium]|nr:glutamate cyclase domain-containing protein [Pirellulales bacterium]